MLRLTGISKRFGTTAALTDVSFDVAEGEVHALLGENGAGKTSLMRIAGGLMRSDAGTVEVMHGGAVAPFARGFPSVRASRDAGIGLVHQHFSSIGPLTVGENVALAAGWRETGAAAGRRATALAASLGLPLDGAARVERLSAQLRQRLEIVKALAADARILLLDEPTAVLAPPEIDELLRVIRDFAARGGSVVLITHKLDEVFEAAERVTVLRRGAVTLTGRVANESGRSLSRAMIGGDLVALQRLPARQGEVLVRAREWAPAPGVLPLTFEFHAGEVTGIAAIEGNGQDRLLRGIAGRLPRAHGLEVLGTIALIPGDRTTEGLILDFTVAENLLLGTIDPGTHWIDWAAVEDGAEALIDRVDVQPRDVRAPVRTLSGGNQQKVVIARALARRPRIIVAEDPSRGLDVQATAAVHGHLRGAARDGAAVVVHSSDVDEVLELSDRLFVMARGQLIEMRSGASRGEVGDAMVGAGPAT